jgi:hypothetical protein
MPFETESRTMNEGENRTEKKCVIEEDESEITQVAESVEKKRWLPELRMSSDTMSMMKREHFFYRMEKY